MVRFLTIGRCNPRIDTSRQRRQSSSKKVHRGASHWPVASVILSHQVNRRRHAAVCFTCFDSADARAEAAPILRVLHLKTAATLFLKLLQPLCELITITRIPRPLFIHASVTGDAARRRGHSLLHHLFFASLQQTSFWARQESATVYLSLALKSCSQRTQAMG